MRLERGRQADTYRETDRWEDRLTWGDRVSERLEWGVSPSRSKSL